MSDESLEKEFLPSCFGEGMPECFGDNYGWQQAGVEICEFCEFSGECSSGVEPCDFCDHRSKCKTEDEEEYP
jgi:hypothetical protein